MVVHSDTFLVHHSRAQHQVSHKSHHVGKVQIRHPKDEDGDDGTEGN